MSISNPNIFPSPIPADDAYDVTAGQQLNIAVQNVFTLQPGLLGNDQAIPGGNGFSLSVTGVGSSPDNIQGVMSLTTDYGQWVVGSDGSFTYVANGLASKQLAENALATDALYYLEKNGFNETAIGQVTFKITGVYDPLVVDFGQSQTLHYSEDSWDQLMQFESGEMILPIPRINVIYKDDGAVVSIAPQISVTCGDLLLDQKYKEQLQNVLNHASISYQPFYSGTEQYYNLELKVVQSDIDFLELGESLTIKADVMISDSLGSTCKESLDVLTIEGVNHLPAPVTDFAEIGQGSVLDRDGSVSVLANDTDPDLTDQGRLQVYSIFSASSGAQVLMDGSAQLSTPYGTLTMYRDGTFSYDPSENYFYALIDLYDKFQYVVTDSSGASSISELTIRIIREPGVVILVPLEHSFFQVGEDLVSTVVTESTPDGSFPGRTELSTFRTQSLSENPPQLEIVYKSFEMTSLRHPDQAIPLAAFHVIGIIPFLSLVKEEGPSDSIWTRTYHLNIDYLMDFQFLNKGDQLTLHYVIRGSGQEFYNREQPFTIYIEGENDAPVATPDYTMVYASQTVSDDALQSSGSLLANDTDADLADDIYVSDVQRQYADQFTSVDSATSIEGSFGTLTISSSGHYVYTANKAEALGIPPLSSGWGPWYDVFTYKIKDTLGAESIATLSIQVLGPRDKPTAMDDHVVVNLGSYDPTMPVLNILANDLDRDPSRLGIRGMPNFPNDYLVLDDNGNLSLKPSAFESLSAGETKTLVFDYEVGNGVEVDGAEQTDTGTVTIQVVGINESPHATEDYYFYQNIPGSTLIVSAEEGLIKLHSIRDGHSDTDADGDTLTVVAIQVAPDNLHELVNGSTTMTLYGGPDIKVTVSADGSFVLDTPDAMRGTVYFDYVVSDGIDTASATAFITIGGPAPLNGGTMINEISLHNAPVVRNVYTDNGAAPDRILVGAASIELLNKSDETISGAALATLTLEIVRPGGGVTTISLGELTGLTQDASGHALNKLFIPAGGILMLYEPGALGWGTWAIYGPHKSFVAGASGSYHGEAWSLGSTTQDELAVNLTQDHTSIDFFAANGANTGGLTGIVGLGDIADHEQGLPGVPWAGNNVGLLSQQQFDGSTGSAADTVFGRVSLTDTDSEQDWSHYVSLARTIGDINTKRSGGVPLYVANPDDPTENLNPNQGQSVSAGQQKQTGSGSLIGGGGYDVLAGQDGDDSLFGDELDDRLYGGGGADHLDGGSGGDWLQGGAGADELRGGTGNDIFVYQASTDSTQLNKDVILDFDNGQDKIDLSQIDADAVKLDDQAFVWGGAVTGRPLAGSAEGKIVYWTQNGVTFVQADAAGDGLPPLELMLSGTHILSVSEFIL